MKRALFAVIIGIGGLAILLALGIWQVQRLAEKQARLADIDARISAPPVDLPSLPNPDVDRYLPVELSGHFTPDTPQRMLASRRNTGAVHRNISVFETTSGRRVLVDLGWTTADRVLGQLPADDVTLIANLDWPREVDGFTPEPDLANGLWFARDVVKLAEVLDTEEFLLVLRENPFSTLTLTAWPVDSSGVPNDHLQYAITWFSLAAIWAAMSIAFVLRGLRGRKES